MSITGFVSTFFKSIGIHLIIGQPEALAISWSYFISESLRLIFSEISLIVISLVFDPNYFLISSASALFSIWILSRGIWIVEMSFASSWSSFSFLNYYNSCFSQGESQNFCMMSLRGVFKSWSPYSFLSF